MQGAAHTFRTQGDQACLQLNCNYHLKYVSTAPLHLQKYETFCMERHHGFLDGNIWSFRVQENIVISTCVRLSCQIIKNKYIKQKQTIQYM